MVFVLNCVECTLAHNRCGHSRDAFSQQLIDANCLASVIEQRQLRFSDLLVAVDYLDQQFGKLNFLVIIHALENLNGMLTLEAMPHDKRVVVNFKPSANEVDCYHLLVGYLLIGIGHLYNEAHYGNFLLVGE